MSANLRKLISRHDNFGHADDATIVSGVNAIRVLLGNRTKPRRQLLVGEEMMAFAKMAAAHRGVAAELADVGDQKSDPAIGNDGLTRLEFVRVKIEQGAILIYAADAENSEIRLEPGKKPHCGVADDIAVQGAQRSTGNRDFDVGITRERRGHVQIVGDDSQILTMGQRLRDIFGRRPESDHE